MIINDNQQNHLRMNVAPDQTIILDLQIFLDHRSLSSKDQNILWSEFKRGNLPSFQTCNAQESAIEVPIKGNAL